jgi:DNA repair protein RadC
MEKTYKSNLPEITLKLTNSGIKTVKITNSKDIAEFMRMIFDEDFLEIYESMFAVYLNRSNRTIGYLKVSQGGLNGTIMDVRLVLKAGIECLCSGIILCHNHPSGNKEPSNQDKEITQNLRMAASYMEINILDHIILTKDSYYSFSDEGLL